MTNEELAKIAREVRKGILVGTHAARACEGAPTCIVAHTVKGKGVSFMENQVGWHGKAPNDEQFAEAMAELEREA